jgi:4-carboxymuconolactone decarboxylase
MARVKDPTADLNPKARVLYESLTAKRGRIDGMYRTLLNHPDLLEHVAQLGTYFRFGDSVLPDDFRELAILHTARRLGVAYEWVKHEPCALDAGINEDVISGLKKNELPAGLSAAQRRVLEAVDYVLAHVSIPAELQSALQKDLGLEAVIELVVLCGFYQMIAAVIFAFDVPLPEGTIEPF